MKKQRSESRFIPSLEDLENRLVLSGNVNALLLKGSLDIVGDNSSDSFSLLAIGQHAVKISSTDGSTTINGQQGPLIITDITAGVYIRLGNGNNNVEASGVVSFTDFAITAGNGNNTIGLANVYAMDDFDVGTIGSGNDTIQIISSMARNKLKLFSGSGEDNVAVVSSTFGANSTVQTTGQNGNLSLTNDTFGVSSGNSGYANLITNDAPIVGNTTGSVTGGESTTLNVLANDQAVVGYLDPKTVTIATQPTSGTVKVNSDGTITYTNNNSATATTDTFTYTVANSFGNVSSPATVTVNIAVQPVPTAGAVTATVNEGGTVSINLSGNTTDSGGTLDLSSLAISTQPSHGTVKINTDGSVNYTNDGTSSTSDSFQYTFKDKDGKVSSPGTVSITVNQPPVANADTATVAVGSSVNINVLANDTDPQGSLTASSVTIVQSPTYGTATANSDGTVTYASTAGTTATTDTFTYTVKDAAGLISKPATVTVTLT